MSYDPRNLLTRFLHLNRLDSSVNYVPSFDPFDIYPPNLHRRNRNRLISANMINKIPDIPNSSSMGTELLDDLRIRQEEFLKRIRKHPSKPHDGRFMI